MLKINHVLKSSRAAIDLASIMVGIIVIGLIGGVIAATVFAVIPWAQDNAAKQQLDPIASAESAYRGLSTSKDANLANALSLPTSQTDPNQVVLNSTFTGSSGLAVNNLLSLNTAGQYCVVATADGKDYHAYSKSGSGKWFYATSSKRATPLTSDIVPCVVSGANAGTVNTAVDDGTKDIPTTPGTGSGTTPDSGTSPVVTNPTTPVYTPVSSYNMETYASLSKIGQPWSPYNSNTNEVRLDTSNRHAGSYGLFVTRNSSTSPAGIILTQTSLTPGATYRVSGWIMTEVNSSVELTSDSTTSGKLTTSFKDYKQVSITVNATSTGTITANFYAYTQYIHLDDVTVEKVS